MSGLRRERGLRELYRDDPERVDAELWDTRWSRRDVLIQAGRGTLAAVLSLPFGVPYPRGFAPAALVRRRVVGPGRHRATGRRSS